MTAQDRADALYGLPPEEFVGARDVLSKELRADGDRPGAAEVKKLARPTRAAWAVNQAVRADPAAAKALAEAGRQLQDAQDELLAGGGPAALREAGDRARTAVDALAAEAARAGDAPADKVRATLHAATVDPDVLEEVLGGRLARDHAASGFGLLGGDGTPKPPGSKRQRATKPTNVRRHGPEHATTDVRGAAGGAAARKEAAAEARAARAAEARAAKEAEARAAKEEQTRARAARDQARRQEKLRRAKEAEAEAEHEADAARRALEQTEAALADRRRQLRAAEGRVKKARERRERAER